MSRPWRKGDYMDALPAFHEPSVQIPEWDDLPPNPPIREHPDLVDYIEGPPAAWFEPALIFAVLLIAVTILLAAIVPAFTNPHLAVSR